MEIIQQMCSACSGRGRTVNWKIINEAGRRYEMLEKIECSACGGKGYTEYPIFTVEEAQAILKHCGIIIGEIGDI